MALLTETQPHRPPPPPRADPSGRRGGRIVPSRSNLVDAGFVTVLCSMALIGFHGVFGDLGWLWVGLLGVGCGLFVGHVCAATRQRAIIVVLSAIGVGVLSSGLVFPHLSAYGFVPTPSSAHQLLRGGLRGWRDLLTVLPPIGGTGGLLAVPYVGALFAALLAFTLATRTSRAGLAIVPPVVLLVSAILVGPAQPASSADFAGTHLPGGVQHVLAGRFDDPSSALLVAQGFGTAVVCLLWAAIQQRRGIAAHGGRLARRPLGIFLTVLITAVLIAVGQPLLTLVVDSPRIVLRDRITPPFDPSAYPSPLAGFRRFTGARTQEVFTVSGLPAGARIRLAAMDNYDGLVWNVAGAASSGSTASGWFERAGERLAYGGTGAHAQVTFHLDHLGGVWLPSITQLNTASIRRPGTDDPPEVFANRAAGVVAVPSGLANSTVVEDVVVPAITDIAQVPKDSQLGRASLPTPMHVPERVINLTRSAVGSGASTPVEQVLALQKTLKAGFYSDGLAGEVESGHGTRRLTTMLGGKLNGNDEQYAALMALALRSLDIPARVVMGFQARGKPADGALQVTGADAAAWVEVDFADYGWIAVDATPDENRKLSQSKPTPQPRPNITNNPIPPQPPLVKEVPPRISGPNTPEQPKPDTPAWLKILIWSAVALGGLVVLAAPAWGLALVKTQRRRLRQHHGSPAARITSGWQELLDLRSDCGQRPSAYATRHEQAALLDLPGSSSLAAAADAATFAAQPPTPEAATAYWAQVRELRKATLSRLTRRRRLWTAVNPASLKGREWT